MTPTVEQLEPRNLASATLAPSSTVAPVDSGLVELPRDNQWGWDGGTLHYIAPSETPGTWVLFGDVQDSLAAQFVTMNADVRSLGLLVQPGSLTLFVVTPTALQQSVSFDAGVTWAPWQVTVSLVSPPAAGPLADPSFVFLAGMDEANPPLVMGTIKPLDGGNVVHVGWQEGGQIYSGTVTAGVLTVQEFDSAWMEPEWVDEVEVWGVGL